MDGGVGRGERVAKKSKQTWKSIRKQKGYSDIYQMIFLYGKINHSYQFFVSQTRIALFE